MGDVHSPEIRSKNMRAIRQKNTRPEIVVRCFLHARGLRFRLHSKKLSGTPDIVLPKYRAVIFVHGCFWHGHNCHLFKLPQSRAEFWEEKINANRVRDERNIASLRDAGWRVVVIWECALKGRLRHPPETLQDELEKWIRFENESAILEFRSEAQLVTEQKT